MKKDLQVKKPNSLAYITTFGPFPGEEGKDLIDEFPDVERHEAYNQIIEDALSAFGIKSEPYVSDTLLSLNLCFGPETVGSRITYALNVDFVTAASVNGKFKQFRLGLSPDYSAVGIAEVEELTDVIRKVVFSAVSDFKLANSGEYVEDELESIVFE